MNLTESDDEAEVWWGKEAAADVVRDRARIVNTADEWIEIPRYNDADIGSATYDEGVAWVENYVARFLKDNGIEARLV